MDQGDFRCKSKTLWGSNFYFRSSVRFDIVLRSTFFYIQNTFKTFGFNLYAFFAKITCYFSFSFPPKVNYCPVCSWKVLFACRPVASIILRKPPFWPIVFVSPILRLLQQGFYCLIENTELSSYHFITFSWAKLKL